MKRDVLRVTMRGNECAINAHFFLKSRVESRCDIRTFLRKKPATPKNMIGPTIRKLRHAQRTKVTQEDLVGRLAVRGVSLDRTALLRIESRARKITDYEALAIADALHVTIEQLFQRS